MRSRGGGLVPCRSATGLAVDTLMFGPSLDMLLTGKYFRCYRSVPHNLARVRADFHPCPKGHPDESPRAHAGRTSRRSDSPGRDGGRSGGSGCAECDVVRTGPQAAGHPAGRTNTGLRRAGRSAMVNFFIHRPVFASVIAVIMILTGLIAYSLLPVAQFPDITPPQVVVTATYPGASSQVVANTVTTPLEQQINGVPGMAYMPMKGIDQLSYWAARNRNANTIARTNTIPATAPAL